MNIAEILKKCPKYTNLYSTIFGEVKLVGVDKKYITCRTSDGFEDSFQYDGKYMAKYHDAECVLFPSRDQRDWSKFGVSDQATDQKQETELKPFDKVLVRDYNDNEWKCDFFSNMNEHGYYNCINSWWHQCIPYEGNEHLLGTTNKQQ